MFNNKRKPTREEHLMRLMEEAQDAVAALTGIKTQFVENGWTEIGAEQAVLVMLQQSNARK